MSRWILPTCGVLLAIAATGMLDLGGYHDFSAFALIPIVFLLWIVERMSRREMGFVPGRASDYFVAAAVPIAIMAVLAAIAAAAGVVDTSDTEWTKVAINLVVLIALTTILGPISEEGFFRGWLWSSLARRGVSAGGAVIWTSATFAAWHITGALAPVEHPLTSSQIVIYVGNAVIIGAMWGLMRAVSGSIWVTSFSHGVWNGLAYSLFGEPGSVAALGIEDTARFGPEVGLLGLGVNLLAVCALWLWARGRFDRDARAGEDREACDR